MQPATVIIDIYGPVVLSAVLLWVGWLFRELRKARRDHQIRIKNLQRKLRRANRRITRNRHTFEATQIQLEQLAKEFKAFPPVREALAVLAAEFENHEKWHQRERQQ